MNNEILNYNWITSFETANETMTHDFPNGMKVVLNFKLNLINTLKDGKVVAKIDFTEDSFTLADYERVLILVARADQQL